MCLFEYHWTRRLITVVINNFQIKHPLLLSSLLWLDLTGIFMEYKKTFSNLSTNIELMNRINYCVFNKISLNMYLNFCIRTVSL